MKRLLLLIVALIAPSIASAQIGPFGGVRPPVFIVQASGVTGGGVIIPAQLLCSSDGTASAPCYSFVSETTLGLFRPTSGALGVANNGNSSYEVAFTTAGVKLSADAVLSWSQTAGGPLATADTIFAREAADHFFQKRTTTAQRASWANTYSSTTSYEAFSIDWQTVANNALVGCRTVATGTTRNCRFVTQNTNGADAYAMLELSYANGATFGLTTNAGAFAASKWNLNASGTETVTQATPATNVQVLTTLATNDDPVENVRQQRAATTDATPATIDTITIPATTTVLISCMVVNRRTGGVSGTAEDGAGYRIEVVMKNVAGTATEIAAETVTTIGESIAGYNVTAAPTGATELIQVTGAATTNITWHSTCRTYLVGS